MISSKPYSLNLWRFSFSSPPWENLSKQFSKGMGEGGMVWYGMVRDGGGCVARKKRLTISTARRDKSKHIHICTHILQGEVCKKWPELIFWSFSWLYVVCLSLVLWQPVSWHCHQNDASSSNRMWTAAGINQEASDKNGIWRQKIPELICAVTAALDWVSTYSCSPTHFYKQSAG